MFFPFKIQNSFISVYMLEKSHGYFEMIIFCRGDSSKSWARFAIKNFPLHLSMCMPTSARLGRSSLVNIRSFLRSPWRAQRRQVFFLLLICCSCCRLINSALLQLASGKELWGSLESGQAANPSYYFSSRNVMRSCGRWLRHANF